MAAYFTALGSVSGEIFILQTDSNGSTGSNIWRKSGEKDDGQWANKTFDLTKDIKTMELN